MKRSLTAWAALSCVALVLFAFASSPGAQAQGATDDPAQVEAGKAVYETNCAGCHGADGAGVAGRGRPLTDIASQQADRAVHFTSVAEGKGAMPAFGERLSDDEIDQAVSYLRLEFVSGTVSTTEELALTGAETSALAIAGATLLAAGLLFTTASRRVRKD